MKKVIFALAYLFVSLSAMCQPIESEIVVNSEGETSCNNQRILEHNNLKKIAANINKNSEQSAKLDRLDSIKRSTYYENTGQWHHYKQVYSYNNKYKVSTDTRLYLNDNNQWIVFEQHVFDFDEHDRLISRKYLRLNDDKLQIFPNPSTDNICFLNNRAEINGCFEIFDFNGNKQLNIQLKNKDCIDIKCLLPGMYFFKLSTKEHTITGKFIRE